MLFTMNEEEEMGKEGEMETLEVKTVDLNYMEITERRRLPCELLWGFQRRGQLN